MAEQPLPFCEYPKKDDELLRELRRVLEKRGLEDRGCRDPFAFHLLDILWGAVILREDVKAFIDSLSDSHGDPLRPYEVLTDLYAIMRLDMIKHLRKASAMVEAMKKRLEMRPPIADWTEDEFRERIVKRTRERTNAVLKRVREKRKG